MSAAPRMSWREHLAVLAVFAALAVVGTWPLASHLSDAVLGPPGDNYEYVYKIWGVKTALLERGQSPLFNPDVFYPAGYDVSLSETTLANMALALPFAAFWGEVVAYNAVVLLSFVLSGWAMYCLARYLTGSRLAGAVAGAVFAFSPYRMAHLGAGHLPLLGTQWIPLAFLFAERAFRTKAVRDGALAGVFLGLTALSSWYYAYMVGLFLALFGALRWAQTRREWTGRRPLAVLAAFAVVAGVVMLPAAIPLLRNAGAGATEYRDLAYIDQWSAGVADFLWPSVLHPVWGEALARQYIPNIQEGVLYLGWAALALAAIGLGRRDRNLRPYMWLGLAGLVLALGTTLHVAGGPVRIPVPDAVARAFARGMYFLTEKAALNPLRFGKMDVAGTVLIPMPTLLLYLFFPFFTAMRVPARFALMAILSVSLLAGAGAASLAERAKARAGRIALSVGLALTLALDLASVPFPLGYSEAKGQPVDAWLAAQPKPSPVAQFPMERTWYGYPLYQQRVHGQPIAYGYGTFVPPAFREAEQILRRFPSEEALAWLEANGVRIVLLAQRSLDESWDEARALMGARQGWELAGRFEDEGLYHGGALMRLIPPTPAIPPSEWVNGDKKSYIQDTIWVYRFSGAGTR